MTKQKAVDKNAQNTIDELERNPVNSLDASQLQRKQDDRRRISANNHRASKS
ncbi:hypothetical protein [Gorillibacterium massiliense]|uniref:hypothetical protein n=1 Tax=Gorillibacterium massiliense TaxID=1280390 RepID=UPI00192E5091|nr:hypothetical protein [Gorillibacterium massiliense]